MIFSSKKCILKFKYITEWGVMKVSANSDIRVVELFAGVGGFRVGLERCSERFKTIWANQWEPGQAGQWAYKCYDKNFGEDSHCVNADIATVIDQVPPHDLLVGGFPCQDYSVASTGAKGIEGKKAFSGGRFIKSSRRTIPTTFCWRM